MSDKTGMAWSFFGVWNDSLLNRKERPMSPRDYMWASELGGAHVDRYLRMKGTTPTNPPNARSLRKFQAGNIWEWLIAHVLKRAGILIDSQNHLKYQYDGMLEVTGKLDMLAGGSPDWDKAIAEVKMLELPELLEQASLEIINQLRTKYGNELKKIILEVKSCSSFMFDRYERTGKANPHHIMQLFHYLKAMDMPEGHIVYVCKDDCRMIELPVFNTPDGNSPAEQMYRADIAAMTISYRKDIQPEVEQEVIFAEDMGKFQKNWKVEYSGYLTMLYGYSEPEAYRMRWDGKVSTFNRTLGRIIMIEIGKTTPTGKPIVLTPGNKEGLEEMKATFPNLDAHIARAVELAKNGELVTEDVEEAL